MGPKRGKDGEVGYNELPTTAITWDRVKETWSTPNTPINPEVEGRGTSSPEIHIGP